MREVVASYKGILGLETIGWLATTNVAKWGLEWYTITHSFKLLSLPLLIVQLNEKKYRISNVFLRWPLVRPDNIKLKS